MFGYGPNLAGGSSMSNCKPRVTIGLAVYNGERFLEQTLDSLLEQSYADFELIISDNASTDRTEEICRVYTVKERRIRYSRNEENRGYAWNYNHLFALSTGEYFKWATADDVCKPDYLVRCVDVLDSDPSIVLAYPKTRFIDETGKLLETTDSDWNLQSESAQERLRFVLYADGWVNSILGLIRSNALSKTRLLASYGGGDYSLLGELSLLGKFYEIPDYLFLRRIHPEASSQHTKDLRWFVEFCTGQKGGISLPSWNRCLDHFTTITRSRLSVRQKMSLIFSLTCVMWWRRSWLLKELEATFIGYMNGTLP